MVEELTKENVKEKIDNNDKPIVIDFYGDWCVPCKRFAPKFEEISKEFPELDFAKYDISLDDKVLATRLEIRSVPCIIVFNKGEEVDRILGEQTEDDFRDKIKEVLGKIK